ncbi:unnamed protein product [Protopolystoma xenopodis]|uniref:Uncharacterized protein n=1 Tax=Protopolystoma xenopodis TaxID=117903 RepID=A0A3S5B2B3_9PLAT|nr:unnamed protein product [Protopolystoma xenopodis]
MGVCQFANGPKCILCLCSVAVLDAIVSNNDFGQSVWHSLSQFTCLFAHTPHTIVPKELHNNPPRPRHTITHFRRSQGRCDLSGEPGLAKSHFHNGIVDGANKYLSL